MRVERTMILGKLREIEDNISGQYFKFNKLLNQLKSQY